MGDSKGAEQPTRVRWHRIFAVAGVFVLILELAAQAYSYGWAGRPYRSFAKYRWSPYGLVRNNPELTMPGYSINANGFRNIENFERTKPPRTLRVLLLGGSVLYSGLASVMVRGAERVDSDRTIAQYLETELENDPALAGMRVEVLNAAVNFNRINEVTAGYLADYGAWEPDVVIVFGSANNFPKAMRKGELAARRAGILVDHPWAGEFDRVANRRTVVTLVEHVELELESHFASVAWVRKVSEKVVDRCFEESDKRSFGRTSRGAAPAPFMDWVEYDAYIEEYLAFADALVVASRRRNCDVAFFWEYFIEHLEGMRSLSDDEDDLRRRVQRPTYEMDAAFNFRARDKVTEHLAEMGVPMIDPRPLLASEPGTIYIDYLHYTAHGNAVMARYVHQSMREVFHRRAEAVRAREP